MIECEPPASYPLVAQEAVPPRPGGLGQGRVASAACEGLARNPAARPGIQIALFVGLAFIESLVLFTFLIIFVKVVK